MSIYRLIYASKKTDLFMPTEINVIIEAATKNNKKLGVTGILCFNRKYFLQWLEGSRDAVNKVYHHICQDKRHQALMILDYQEVKQRQFNNWDMEYIPDTAFTAEINLKYSENIEFDPFTMSGASSAELLKELSQYVAE